MLMNDFRIKKSDIIIIAVLVILSALPLLLTAGNIYGNADRYVEIYSDGKLYKEIKLDEELSYEFTVKSDGGTNVIVISKGEVYMHSSSCRDQICVRQGPVSRLGRSIVCLPNRIYIEITGKEPPEIDDIAK